MLRSAQFTSDKGLGKVALAAFGLGVALALHAALLALALWGPLAPSARGACVALWSLYVIALCVFHMSEFLLTAAFRPSTVSYECACSVHLLLADGVESLLTCVDAWTAFLLNHSREYHLALLLSSVEFWVEFALVPEWKVHPAVLPAGVAIVVVGQALRVAAMWTAAANFSHRIEYQKRQEHVLVTHGVYRFVRHPSYMGWFLWTVGSQVLLGNPVCGLGYTIVSWGFFRDRIPCVAALLARMVVVMRVTSSYTFRHAAADTRSTCSWASSQTSTPSTARARSAASRSCRDTSISLVVRLLILRCVRASTSASSSSSLGSCC